MSEMGKLRWRQQRGDGYGRGRRGMLCRTKDKCWSGPRMVDEESSVRRIQSNWERSLVRGSGGVPMPAASGGPSGQWPRAMRAVPWLWPWPWCGVVWCQRRGECQARSARVFSRSYLQLIKVRSASGRPAQPSAGDRRGAAPAGDGRGRRSALVRAQEQSLSRMR